MALFLATYIKPFFWPDNRLSISVATRFRIWATQHLHEYIVKGFVLDDERLKHPDLRNFLRRSFDFGLEPFMEGS